MTPSQFTARLASLGSLALVVGSSLAQTPSLSIPESFDHTKVMGAESCAKCHESEVNQWRLTPHHLTINELHRKPEAKAITKRLGLKSVKRNDTCVRCHYTRNEVRGRVRIDSGVSCESCHGPSKDWFELHADYGPRATRLTESPEHRQERRTASIAAGMNNPSNLYLIARQCLNCHTTPDERLVDEGGHPAGSPGFDLVAWSQGTVRHNFVRSDGAINAISSPDRLRVMYVVGVMTDLEYSLRAISKATKAGMFAKTSALRAAERKLQLWEVQRRIDNPLIQPALDHLATIELKLGESESLLAAADVVSQAAMAFAEQADGAQLTGIDELMPKASQYK